MLDGLMASELGLLLLRLLVLLHVILMLTHAMLFVALTLNSLDLLSQAGVTLLLLFLMTTASVLRVTLFLGLCGSTSVRVLLLLLLANAMIGGMVVRLLVVVVAVAVALGRGMERRDVEDGTRVLATLLVVIVLALVVELLRLHLMLRSSGGGIGSSRVLHELLDWRLVFVHRNRIWLGNSHWDLFVHFHDLGEWHWHMLDHMDGIGDGMRHLHRIGHWHFNGHRFRDPDLLRRQMVLAHECAQMLQLGMLGVPTAAAATSAVDTSIGHDDAKRGYANDTEDLQR